MLSQYKDIFGKPGEGVHATRIFGLAFWDVLMTFIFIIIFSHYAKTSFIDTTLITFVVATGIHILFGVDTALVKMLNGSKSR